MPVTATIHVGVICHGTATGWTGRFDSRLPVTANIHVGVICHGTATVWTGRFVLNLPVTAYLIRRVVLYSTSVRGVCHRKRRDNHQEQYQREFRNTIPETCTYVWVTLKNGRLRSLKHSKIHLTAKADVNLLQARLGRCLN